MKNLVSVIIPTYKRANLIFEAISSVLAQTYQNFEIIVINDGYQDETEQIIAKINDPRVKYIYQENSGPASARNTGIKNANGCYIAFLDSDDLWHEDKLEKQLKILDKNPRVGIVSCHSSYRDFEGNEIFKKISNAKNNMDYVKGLVFEPDRVFTGTPTLMIRKECLDRSGMFDESLKLFEDWDLCFRIALNYDVAIADEVLTIVRTSRESFSAASDEIKFKENYLRYLDKIFENKELPSDIKQGKNSAYGNVYWYIGNRTLYSSKNKALALECFQKSLSYSKKRLKKFNFCFALILSLLPICFLDLYLKYRKFKKGY